MAQKIVFFDIDGTLLDHDKKLPNSAYEAISALKEKGYIVAIATGRAAFAFESLRELLDIHTYVSLNGQYVVHEDKVIYKNPLDVIELEKLIAMATKQNHPLVYMNDKGWETNVENNPYVQRAIQTLKIDVPIVFDPDAYKKDEKYQTLLFCKDNEEKMYQESLDQFEYVRWHDYSVDILPKGGSKAIGIEKLLTALQIKGENCYAFGDGLNDKEMLSFVHNSVAMGNAVEEVKAVATYVTKPVDEDGIYDGLKKLKLL